MQVIDARDNDFTSRQLTTFIPLYKLRKKNSFWTMSWFLRNTLISQITWLHNLLLVSQICESNVPVKEHKCLNREYIEDNNVVEAVGQVEPVPEAFGIAEG